MTLYELTQDEKRFLEMAEAPEIEIPSDASEEEKAALLQQKESYETALRDTYEMVHMDFLDKANSYGKVLRQILADAEAAKKEKLRLAAMQSRLEKNAERLKEAMKSAMVELGHKQLKTELFTYSTRAGQELVIDAESVYELPMEMVRVVDPVPDKMAIKKYIKEHAGEEITWAHMEPTVSLIVK